MTEMVLNVTLQWGIFMLWHYMIVKVKVTMLSYTGYTGIYNYTPCFGNRSCELSHHPCWYTLCCILTHSQAKI